MNTSLKAIMTAIGIAVLASPVMAQPNSNTASTTSTSSISNARGSVARTHATRVGRETSTESNQVRIEDCVHVQFPQCGGDSTQADSNRP